MLPVQTALQWMGAVDEVPYENVWWKILATARYVPAAAPAGSRDGLDVPAQLAGVLCLGGLTWALIEAWPHGWASLPVLGGLGVSASALPAFVLLERRARAPMLPLELFGARRFSASAVRRPARLARRRPRHELLDVARAAGDDRVRRRVAMPAATASIMEAAPAALAGAASAVLNAARQTGSAIWPWSARWSRTAASSRACTPGR
ncbi:hypothetical protein HTZ77_32075 [Nonomuraea sp. SMC257]|uniref:MFS transporter n=1 Tax=Nonomuraea montanisoli TaxID=2741721 RepID=A0A7Y6IE85_9ACTN|nr:hypothetical protein [Nonomuraea montanisoli]NUW36023.1 hypothetical protein [Nonomuraea montanisoli]